MKKVSVANKSFVAIAMIMCTMSACSKWSGGNEASVKSFVAEYMQAANDRDEEKLASMYVYPQQAALALKVTSMRLTLKRSGGTWKILKEDGLE